MLLSALASYTFAQTPWVLPGNGSTNPGNDYVGTSDNQDLVLRTTATPRFRLNRTVSYTIGSFGAQVSNGYLGLSPNGTLWTNGPGPFSRLHLHDGTTAVLQASYRSWMDNGITFTTNSDQMYIGHKVESGTDQTAAVIQWGDNDAPTAGPDVLKFLFTAGYSGGTYGASALNGLELGRFHPQGWLGLGNWQASGIQPDERLDLLNRTIRLRDFTHPTLYRNNTYDRILVANPADGRVYWRDANTLGGDDCDWVIQSLEPHVSNVYDGTSCDWDMRHGVGIGVDYPKFKLHVYHTKNELLDPTAIYGDARFDLGTGHVIGVFGQARPTAVFNGSIYSTNATGVIGKAYNYRWTTGVEGYASTAQAAFLGCEDLIGVKGIADAGGNAIRSIGVYGSASGGYASTWGGYFEGRGFLGASAWTYSDANLKEGVEDLDPQAMINATAT